MICLASAADPEVYNNVVLVYNNVELVNNNFVLVYNNVVRLKQCWQHLLAVHIYHILLRQLQLLDKLQDSLHVGCGLLAGTELLNFGGWFQGRKGGGLKVLEC